ncbi:MAG: prepilin peptidase [Candidatus Saccharicenans sp.]|nr:prepilin peptidase [Candidatus Saccharicenans sp.]
METLRLILVAVVGLVWGSFLNVVIYRLPRDLSLVRPPSSCPRCGRRIKWYDNTGMLS